MKKIATFVMLTGLLFSGCGDNNDTDSDEHDHEHGDDERSLIFYNDTTNDHLVYDMHEEQLIDLNNATYIHDDEEQDISNFNLTSSQSGVPFVWLDNKGDDDVSNDEEKIIMFNSSYDFQSAVTWEDFYYLGHFHEADHDHDEEETEEHAEDEEHAEYVLAAHSNDEFDVTSGGKYEAMERLTTYITEQNQLKIDLASALPDDAATSICGVYTNIDLEENITSYYAMGTNGTFYAFDKNDTSYTYVDQVAVADSCTPNEMGMSGIENGVWVFLKDTQTIYEVDKHDDGVYHIHETMDASDYIGVGKSANVMVSIKPVD